MPTGDRSKSCMVIPGARDTELCSVNVTDSWFYGEF